MSAFSSSALTVRADGTVVSAGDDTHGQCDIGDWTDVRLTP